MKKIYFRPELTIFDLDNEALMAATSPGIGTGEADKGIDAGAKDFDLGGIDLWGDEED